MPYVIKTTQSNNYSSYGNCSSNYENIVRMIPVAYFSTEALAKKYLRAAELKQKGQGRKYKRGSMLSGCDDAWIDWVDSVPLDPEIDF